VRGKLTIFPFGQYVVGNICSLAFWRHSQFQDTKLGVREISEKSNSAFTTKSRLTATMMQG